MHRVLRSGVAAILLVLAVAGTTEAKGNARAELDAPISTDARPGAKIEVAWRAWVPDSGGEWPFAGSPVFIRLTSPDGMSSTEAFGVEDPRGSGYYLATIEVPDGGVSLVEVGLFGESCVNGTCSRSDILFTMADDRRAPRAAAGGGLLVAIGTGLARWARVTHGPARVAAPAHAGLRREGLRPLPSQRRPAHDRSRGAPRRDP